MQSQVHDVSSVILLGSCGRLILQQRDDVPGILYPGLIGLFGGHREAGETALECARREIHEEIGHLLPADRFELLLETSTRFHGWIDLHQQVFLARAIPSNDLVVTEGRALFAGVGELAALYGHMTPSAVMAVRYFATTAAATADRTALPGRPEQPHATDAPLHPSQQQQ